MIINATSHTIKNIWIFFTFIFVVFLALIVTLIHGVTIESIVLPKIKMAQLYIKLDKKLIVTIKEIDISKETQTDTSLEEMSAIVHNMPYLNQFFSEISIQTLRYDNEQLHILFKDNLFKFDSKHVTLACEITPVSRYAAQIRVQHAYLKDYFLTLKGDASIDFKTHTYTYEGNFNLFGIDGITLLNVKNNLLSYHFQTEHFTNQNLKSLMDFLVLHVSMEELIKAWIDTYIVAQDYQLHFLEGKFDLKSLDYFPLEIKGSATAKDTLVYFAPNVEPAHIEEVGISLQNDQLLFDVHQGSYAKKPIEKADVYIDKLIAVGTRIIVDLNTTAQLNDDVHKILQAFNIDVPITQTSGKTDAHLNLNIRFLPFDINATGEFKAKNSHFILADVPMYTKSATVKLDNYHVYLDKANLSYKELFDINATGLFDTKKQTFNGFADLDSVKLNFSDASLLSLTSHKENNATLKIDDNGTHIQLPSLATSILFAPQNNSFTFGNLALLAPYSALMRENTISLGELEVKTADFTHFFASLKLDAITTPFLDNNHSLSALSLDISTNTHQLDANSSDGRLRAHFDQNLTIYINDLNISLPEDHKDLDVPLNITLIGTNSSFIGLDTNRTILSDSYQLFLKPKYTHLQSHKNRSTFEYEKKSGSMTLVSNALDDNFTNQLLGKLYFEKGDFSLHLEGKDDTHYEGTFILHQTYIKDMKFFDNLMSTINAIPSLIVFSDPKFNQSGYYVEMGYIEFVREGALVRIKDMKLTGNNADIEGKGEINLDKNTIVMPLRIKTLNTISSFIDFIPIVGGIILGEDKRISTNIDVTGSLDNPNIETHLIFDTIKSPLNIIKRTLEAPIEIFTK